MRTKKIIGLLWVIGILTFSGCGKNEMKVSELEDMEINAAQQTEVQREVFAMDTYMTVTAYGENAKAAADAAIEEIERLDELLSTGNEDGEVGQINKTGGGYLSDDTAYLLARATELCKETDGAFDITIYPIMEAWGFTTQNYQVPSEDTLKSLLALTDGMQVEIDEESKAISFGIDGMKIDFGGIAKGYTSSRIIEIWEEYGISSGMINLGGNVQLLGRKTDGSEWKIGIQRPDSVDDYLGILSVHDKAVITSGGYERYFEQDGVSYHHIIDPATGYPANSGLVSVTIVSEDGTLADGLSTSLFVMGKEKAIEFWKSHSEEFDAILMTEDDVLYVTGGIAENFTSEMTVEIVNK